MQKVVVALPGSQKFETKPLRPTLVHVSRLTCHFLRPLTIR
jgi:hypothetical protein